MLKNKVFFIFQEPNTLFNFPKKAVMRGCKCWSRRVKKVLVILLEVADRLSMVLKLSINMQILNYLNGYGLDSDSVIMYAQRIQIRAVFFFSKKKIK